MRFAYRCVNCPIACKTRSPPAFSVKVHEKKWRERARAADFPSLAQQAEEYLGIHYDFVTMGREHLIEVVDKCKTVLEQENFLGH